MMLVSGQYGSLTHERIALPFKCRFEFIERIVDMDPRSSRSDKFFTDDAVTFNATVYNQTRAYWTGDLIDIQMVANARLARMVDSVKYNPKFALSELAGAFSAGEGAGYMLVFGNKTAKTARRDFVEYFFGICHIQNVCSPKC
jgi:hypothetical protein